MHLNHIRLILLLILEDFDAKQRVHSVFLIQAIENKELSLVLLIFSRVCNNT
jgi:hypothetical protein